MKNKCSSCKIEKDTSEFNKHKANGTQAYCRECSRTKKRIYRYGVTQHQYEQMLSSQNNTCKCCQQSFESAVRGRKRYPVVDHNHKTGRIRGLLCDRCNWNIGSFEADNGPELVEKVLKYIKDHS